MRYASKTSVPASRSRAEVEEILKRYKAEAFGYATDGNRVEIKFRIASRFIRFMVPMPDPAKDRSGQLERQRWRAILLSIKAKLECVESGIETIEQAFMAHVVMPDGKTLGETLKPQIESAYKSGKMPPMLGYAEAQ